MNLPLVSICIPTYNGETYLDEALSSIQKQSYKHLEVIVSDDGSIDSTLKKVEVFKNIVDYKVNIYLHQPKGIGANWNNCIKNANGAYIKFLFQDDVLLPECIEDMVKVLEHNPSVGLVACKRDIIFPSEYFSAKIEAWIKTYGDLQKNLPVQYENNLHYIDKGFFKTNVFHTAPYNKIGEPSAYMFRKEVINEIGYFREDLKQILDYEFCYRLLKTHRISFIDKKLVKFRLHELQATNINKGTHNDKEIYNRIIYKEYFWLLNTHKKITFLKRYNPLFKLMIKLKKIFLKF